MRLKDLSETFRHELRDPEFAAGYLQAALEENDFDTFLVALKDILQANGEITKTVQEKDLGAQNLQNIFVDANPQFSTLQAVLKSVGLQFSITASSEVTSCPVEQL